MASGDADEYDGHQAPSMSISPGDGVIHLSFDSFSYPGPGDYTTHYWKSVPGLATEPASQDWVPGKFSASQLPEPNVNCAYPRFVVTPENKLQLETRCLLVSEPKPDYRRWSRIYEYSGGVWTNLGRYIDNLNQSSSAYLPQRPDVRQRREAPRHVVLAELD